MEKRLTRTEMFFSLGFLFMLIVAVGAFFYGVQVGSDKTEAKFVESAKSLSSKSTKIGSYQQQDLVSFYHTVFLPYREFQSEWFDTMHKLSTSQISDISSALKELASIADQRYKEAEQASVPNSASLLQSAQLDLLKSLKMFSENAQRAASSSKDMEAGALLKTLKKDPYYIDGVKFALSGQQNYYSAMQKWGASVDPNIPSSFSATSSISLKGWSALQLTIKNKLMADELNSRKLLAPYYPQDLTARVDQFIGSGQAATMNKRTVASVVDLLIRTDAVRQGDFAESKAELYAKQLVPQLPFFFPEK
ncbi:hypothetical protein [Paenibacillus sp. OV219]|uniref:hypothetical protein n=1 Tax=Paenibacillus sp. OV219 TaxID=1884377 RepID=UPI0008B3372C|nr:hypothetical protein [Paenibacillus sp. OV219]SEN23647.1 hypothetical protein SAMN05518847_102484 [Paenibacillus sp. OV219]